MSAEPTSMTFVEFPKIPRRGKVFMRITEKLDGTNAQINIPEDESAPLLVCSRNRIITPSSVSGNKSSDNFGFAQWVLENETMLRRLGPGRHYGEWWGAGIGRKYGLAEKRFSLFNVERFRDGLPDGVPVSLVPTLYTGEPSMSKLESVLNALTLAGSVAVPGWMQPEGVVVELGGMRWKEILDKQGPSPEEGVL